MKNRIKIDIEELFTKIDVLPPYFALKNLEIDTENIVYASIPKEQNMGSEIGIISGAEVGRHLAILGSCAVASINESEGKHYYLAYEATIKMINDEPYLAKLENEQIPYLLGKAKAEILSKKRAKAECSILNEDGDILYTLDVNYKIVPENMFLRINAQYIYTKKLVKTNPYLKPLEIFNQRFENTLFKTTIGSVNPQWCLGHFLKVPVLPVAHLMYCITECINQHLQVVIFKKAIKFQLITSTIWAENIAFSGEIIDFESQFIESNNYNYHFICNAFASTNKNIGKIDAWIRVIE